MLALEPTNKICNTVQKEYLAPTVGDFTNCRSLLLSDYFRSVVQKMVRKRCAVPYGHSIATAYLPMKLNFMILLILFSRRILPH